MEAFEIAGGRARRRVDGGESQRTRNANSHSGQSAGSTPEGEPLKAAEGITYIRLGDAHLTC